MPKEKRGFLDFKRKNGRPDFSKMQGTTPHDKRFEPFNYYPRVYSKSKYFLNLKLKRPSTAISFNKTLPRDDKLYQVNLTPSTYTVNIDA